MRKAEITWSLMHPTPLNVEYMKQVVRKAAEYRVDSFEICADCHTNLGGMDGLADYAEYPETHRRIDLAGIAANRRKLGEILELAHAAGKPVLYWHREAMVPDGLLVDRPDLLDANGEFDLLGAAYAELLRYKIDATFRAMPALDGLVLTLTEASYSVIHNSNTAKFPPRKVVEHLVRIFASELRKRNKRFVLRSFGSIAQDYEDILAGAAAAAREYGFEIETKITPYDFDPFLPVNPFLRKLPGAQLGAECDCLGEFLGAGMLPAENVENIVNYVRTGQTAGVDRYAIRLDRIGNRTFDCYEVNLYAYERAIDDPAVTAADIRREWLAQHAPASAREAFLQLGLDGFEVVKKTNFIAGNVIFHQFPSQPMTKYLKAGFIFALFKNGVDLHNGAGVWSILAQNRTPGRAAILREKEEACALVEKGLSLLNSLPVEPGWEAEYAWRKRLWENAKVAATAFLWLCRIVCAYFDDMESGDNSAASLTAAVAAGRRTLCDLAGYDLGAEETRKTRFVNGLDTDLFHESSSATVVYLKPFYAIFGILADEYETEFAMRRKYVPGTVDCILCGVITDEWRIARYMHACHANFDHGEFFRYAGNTVFPNGFLEMELARPANGGRLVIYGDAAETADFRIELDGKPPVAAAFDASGAAEFPLAPGAGNVRVRLTKAPGPFYPRFRAATTVR
ncbi:MAG: hypothetical protein MR051_07780 [Lentisphaeria bacterium]|nr:hypothetical protein [Lentisphaeria bacterium]